MGFPGFLARRFFTRCVKPISNHGRSGKHSGKPPPGRLTGSLLWTSPHSGGCASSPCAFRHLPFFLCVLPLLPLLSWMDFPSRPARPQWDRAQPKYLRGLSRRHLAVLRTTSVYLLYHWFHTRWGLFYSLRNYVSCWLHPRWGTLSHSASRQPWSCVSQGRNYSRFHLRGLYGSGSD
jgi:hypothetical protein